MLRRVSVELDRYDENGRVRPTALPAAPDRPSIVRATAPARADAE